MRWWTGSQWERYQDEESTDLVDRGKAAAILAHFGILVTGTPLLPLLIRLTVGRQNPFVRHHATEALNFMILFMLIFIPAVFVGGYSLATSVSDNSLQFTLAQVVGELALLGGLACSMVAAVNAANGKWWRYPVTLRLFR